MRVSGYTLEHDCSATVQQGAVHNVRVTSDPTTVRDAAENVLLLQ